jgi:hypothetical protein
MSGNSVVVVLLVLLLPGCARLHAPRGSVPQLPAAQTDAFGGWARVTYAADAGVTLVEGELIAVSPDSLWLLRREGPLVVAAAAIRQAEVTGYDSKPDQVVLLAAVGFLSTISNGVFLIFTAPAWLITGAAGSSAQARASRRTILGRDLAPLAPFARFPQGIPPRLDLHTLTRRP